ncbi:coiled-coil domain containing 169 [Fundulus heteroclitus]|uniref:coiled-coil domain containing 169 n=1 Tax=Fundulus heteroclitus TaxID=8078 RepID=UPI00165C24D4|nr:coiled-coil domain containing 169 [Fundulus heteroclitus]XP_035998514.1 coiled-coil domain containing 169 [Fundulus heteroclitus]XP_035998515.1 coiled-coil domain containing 169 [Fundulus heteroclitus]
MAKRNNYSENDLARLRAELMEEREIKEMLVESVCDLRCTVAELQDRLRSVDGEGNEWKTRFETQVELNGQLERQISHLQQRLEGIKVNPVDRLAFIRSYEDMAVEMLKQHLEVLSEEKSDLQSRLRDRHLQIDLEGKAFHKTNDERRAYLTEIATLSSFREQQRRQRSNHRQGAPVSKRIRAHRGKDIPRKAQHGSNNGAEEGFRECVNGGGGDSKTERGMKKKCQRESMLPTLKQRLRHNP